MKDVRFIVALTVPDGTDPGEVLSELRGYLPEALSGPSWRYASVEVVSDQVTAEQLVRAILEAVCARDGISLDSDVDPGSPARNYELALRLRIGHVFGLEAKDGG